MQKNGNANGDAKKDLVEWIDSFFSVKGVFSLRNVIVMSMMAAVAVVLGQFSIYVTPNFKAVSIAYLPGAVVAMLYGPWAALVFGFVSDTIKFVVKPSGSYFIGYALSEMFSYFIYAIFFYKQPIKLWKVIAARILILVTIVFGLNYLWTMIIYGTAASKYFTGVRLINNLIQFPFHVALITVVNKFVRKHSSFLLFKE